MDAKFIMQSQNFEFVRKAWPELASLGGFTEHYVNTDPESAVVKLRVFAECSVDAVYRTHSLPKATATKFMKLFSNEGFVAITHTVVITKLHAIRINGNRATHDDKCTSDAANWLYKGAWDLIWWYFAVYDEGNIKTFSEITATLMTDSKGQFKKFMSFIFIISNSSR